MKTNLKIEELFQFLIGIAAFSQLHYSWWVFPALILLPDISMIGYLVNTKIGAISYNLFHSKTLAIAFLGLGYFYLGEAYILVGIILYSHSAMDRFFGYGLKYSDSFKNTHLGLIGKK